MFLLSTILFFLPLALSNPIPSPRNVPPTIDLPYASYSGYHNATSGLDVFLGVRYADTTIGRNRWREAQPPPDVRSGGVLNATVQPKQCPQATSGGVINSTAYSPYQTVDDEDCLFLNVYRPPGAKDLPVLVWIHGGGYDHNSARDFDPTPMIINTNSSFIGVIIQMRLGAFGFLSPPSSADSSPNVGITDARHALLWVRSHIHAFGGDPSSVSIWGQSSGGGTVLQLVNAENTLTGGDGTSEPLFRSAIVSSPYLVPMGPCEDYGSSFWEQQFHNFSVAANCTDSIDCLRNATTDTLRELNHVFDAYRFPGHSNAYSPCIEGSGGYIKQNTAERLWKGEFEGANILGGNNYNDGSSFVSTALSPPANYTDVSSASDALLTTWLTTNFPVTTSDITATLALYPYASFADGHARAAEVFQDVIFGCHTTWLTRARKSSGYRYLFADGTSIHATDNAWEFPYQYNTLEPYSPTAYASYLNSITSFIRSTPPNPNTHKPPIVSLEPDWPTFGTDYDGRYEVFNYTTPTNVSDAYISSGAIQIGTEERCEFWGRVRSANGW